MYCVECGFQNPEAANFCARCGTLLVTDEPAGQTTMSFPVPDDEAGVSPHLVIRQGGGRAGERVPLRASRETIGRSPEASLFLDDVTVSRRHAQIERTADGWAISDLGSLNGTYVNRNRIERAIVLRDGDEVQVGKFKLTFLEH